MFTFVSRMTLFIFIYVYLFIYFKGTQKQEEALKLSNILWESQFMFHKKVKKGKQYFPDIYLYLNKPVYHLLFLIYM